MNRMWVKASRNEAKLNPTCGKQSRLGQTGPKQTKPDGTQLRKAKQCRFSLGTTTEPGKSKQNGI